MACRGTALAFALVLLSASVCTCLTVTFSKKIGALTDKDRNIVYSALHVMVNNRMGDIHPDMKYNAGRLFTKYVNLMTKNVVIRFTRWSSECSVSMSSSEQSEGREMLAAWKLMVPSIKSYLDRGYDWVSVSNNTDWIDYYVIKDAPPVGAPPLNVDTYDVLSDVGDCTIQPYMLLSHQSALPFSQLLPGDTLVSPDYNYCLTIPFGDQDTDSTVPCVLNLEDADGRILWNSSSFPLPQDNCYLALRSDGTLELWNKNSRIWYTGSACPSGTNCAGAASLAFVDGGVKLYKSLHNYHDIYWSS